MNNTKRKEELRVQQGYLDALRDINLKQQNILDGEECLASLEKTLAEATRPTESEEVMQSFKEQYFTDFSSIRQIEQDLNHMRTSSKQLIELLEKSDAATILETEMGNDIGVLVKDLKHLVILTKDNKDEIYCVESEMLEDYVKCNEYNHLVSLVEDSKKHIERTKEELLALQEKFKEVILTIPDQN